MVTRNGTRFDGKGCASVTWRKAGREHVAGSPAKIENHDVLRLVPNFFFGERKQVIDESCDGFVEQIEIGKLDSRLFRRGQRIRPLVYLERGGHGYHRPAGSAPASLPRTVHQKLQ